MPGGCLSAFREPVYIEHSYYGSRPPSVFNTPVSPRAVSRSHIIAHPGSYSMSMQLQVTIPPGVAPGQQMLVQNPYGGQVSVVVPAGVQPGQAILVQVPAPVPQPYYSAPQPPTESHRPAPRAPEPPRQPEPPSRMERQRTQQLARAQYQREVASRSAPPTTKTLSNPVMAMCSSSSGGLARCLPWTMVTTGTVQILERFGKYTMVAHPGCHVLNPCLCDCVAAELSMRVQQLDAHCETKTKVNTPRSRTPTHTRTRTLHPIPPCPHPCPSPRQRLDPTPLTLARTTSSLHCASPCSTRCRRPT